MISAPFYERLQGAFRINLLLWLAICIDDGLLKKQHLNKIIIEVESDIGRANWN